MRRLLVLTFLLLIVAPAKAAAPRTMRLDYFHTAGPTQEVFALDRIVLEPLPWPGNSRRTVDDLNLGKFLFEVRDGTTKKITRPGASIARK